MGAFVGGAGGLRPLLHDGIGGIRAQISALLIVRSQPFAFANTAVSEPNVLAEIHISAVFLALERSFKKQQSHMMVLSSTPKYREGYSCNMILEMFLFPLMSIVETGCPVLMDCRPLPAR